MGGENVDLAHFMVLLRGEGRGSHLTGRSVHNQRIEHLWRDVFADCLSLFYHLFYFMESRGILDCEKPQHLYALHMCIQLVSTTACKCFLLLGIFIL